MSAFSLGYHVRWANVHWANDQLGYQAESKAG